MIVMVNWKTLRNWTNHRPISELWTYALVCNAWNDHLSQIRYANNRLRVFLYTFSAYILDTSSVFSIGDCFSQYICCTQPIIYKLFITKIVTSYSANKCVPYWATHFWCVTNICTIYHGKGRQYFTLNAVMFIPMVYNFPKHETDKK